METKPFTLDAFREKRDFFDKGATLDYKFRINQLKALSKAIIQHEKEIETALFYDLRKSDTESFFSEIGFIQAELDYTIKRLKNWMKPRKRSSTLVLEPSNSEIRYQPKGVVLIIAPWNYPFHIALGPVIGAIAAGNCVVLKPSEEAFHTSNLLEEMIGATFQMEYFSVVQGLGHEVVPQMIRSNTYNHIFFTGSPGIGKIIASLAAEQLTSTTLELGGKSPAIVDATANLKVAAKRIVWGKLLNNGQACVAPDYLLAEASIKDELVSELKKVIVSMFGENPQQSESLPRLISEKRFETVQSYLSQGNILFGGQTDVADLYIAPTLMDQVRLDTPIMQEEIFGPILPILTFTKNEEILDVVRKNRYPLACYYFGNDKTRKALVLDQIEFGGGCVNDTMVHLGNPSLPFGGVQSSGSGNYHGWYSFECFSNAKAIVHGETWVDPPIRYAPFTAKKKNWLKKLMRT